jgi:FKBP-type peptidyl-prolyl cis-trans isomerase SlyD
MTRPLLPLALILLGTLLGPAPGAAQAPAASAPASPAAPSLAIERGSTVRIEYTLRDEAGAVLDSNKGEPALTYTQGEQQIIPGLERELFGMQAGQQKKVVVKPEDAHGEVNPAALAEVPKNLLPPGALKAGTRVMARSADGETRPVTVKEIKDDTVVLDLNHPLAGKTLHFDVKVLGVEAPRATGPKPPNGS